MHLDLNFWLTSLVLTFFPEPTLDCQILAVETHQFAGRRSALRNVEVLSECSIYLR
jgi:hypothetical protein